MVNIEMGAVKFKSIKAAFETAKKKQPKLKYITFYQRLRYGDSVKAASIKPVRPYKKAV